MFFNDEIFDEIDRRYEELSRDFYSFLPSSYSSYLNNAGVNEESDVSTFIRKGILFDKNDKELKIYINAVGFKKEQVNVEYDSNTKIFVINFLIKKGEKNLFNREEKEDYKKTIKLKISRKIDEDSVEAKIEDGILKISAKYSEDTNKKLIEVK